jgi:aminopeptidase N
VRRLLGDDRFFELVRGWAAARRFGTATTADFEAYAAGFSAEPLDDFFDAWLRETRLPSLSE